GSLTPFTHPRITNLLRLPERHPPLMADMNTARLKNYRPETSSGVVDTPLLESVPKDFLRTLSCRLMGIGRYTFCDMSSARARGLAIVAEMKTICDEFEAYGYRRVGAELRHRGIVVNAKKIRRLMREHALNPKQRRRFIATTTNSDHNYPIFPNLAKNMQL